VFILGNKRREVFYCGDLVISSKWPHRKPRSCDQDPSKNDLFRNTNEVRLVALRLRCVGPLELDQSRIPLRRSMATQLSTAARSSILEIACGCCEAWLCPAVSWLRFRLGYALKLLHWKHIEGEAQNQLSLAHGRAEPCLTTAGKAESK